jgi:DnaJ-class molecular chaperone
MTSPDDRTFNHALRGAMAGTEWWRGDRRAPEVDVLERVTCPECGGTGVDFDVTLTAKLDCSECHGAGTISGMVADQRERQSRS